MPKAAAPKKAGVSPRHPTGPQPNHERMVRTFLDLVRVDSLSRKEKALALMLQSHLRDLGLEVAFDEAGEKVGGDTGNLIAVLRGDPKLPPFLLSSHMDTVGPGEGIRPIVHKDKIETDGRTILGGDCKSGIAVILEVLHLLKESGRPHGDVEIALTVCEEVGLLGAKYLDAARLRSTMGLVLDSPSPLELTVQAPAADHMVFEVHGKEAHSGAEPEKGISAIQIASQAISGMKLGRVDPKTTANIGKINGGIADNIIPGHVRCEGEARSLDERKLEAQSRHMTERFIQAAAELGGRVESKVERAYPSVSVPTDAEIAKLAAQAAANLGRKMKMRTSGGASDANILNRRGIQAVDLGTGMREIHTVREWLDLPDFFLSAEIVLETLRLHSQK